MNTYRERRGVEFKHARVVSVYELNDGDELDGDHAGSLGTLTLLDVSDFTEDGGKLVINGEDVFTYTAVDFDANTITLSGTTTDAYDDGTKVEAYPLAPTRYAQVLSFDDDDSDFAEARIPHHYVPIMSVGPRLKLKNQESVVLIHDGNEWVIFDVLGKRAKLTSDHAPAERTFRYTAEGIAASGYSGIKLKGYDGTAIAARAHVDVAPTSDATWDVYLAGASVGTLTIADGHKWSDTLDLSGVTFDEQDAWRIHTDDPQDADANLTVYVYVTLNADDEDLS